MSKMFLGFNGLTQAPISTPSVSKRDGLEKPFKQLVSYAFSKYHSNKDFDLKQLTTQKKKAKTQLEKLEERFAIGKIGQDLYQKYTQKFSDEMAEIEQKIDFG